MNGKKGRKGGVREKERETHREKKGALWLNSYSN